MKTVKKKITSISGKTFTLTLGTGNDSETFDLAGPIWNAFGVQVSLGEIEGNGMKAIIIPARYARQSTFEKEFNIRLKTGTQAVIRISEKDYRRLLAEELELRPRRAAA